MQFFTDRDVEAFKGKRSYSVKERTLDIMSKAMRLCHTSVLTIVSIEPQMKW